MIAQDFARDDCKLGKRRISYAKLVREYRCDDCGGRLAVKWDDGRFKPPNFAEPAIRTAGWHIECGRCGSADFVHENEI